MSDVLLSKAVSAYGSAAKMAQPTNSALPKNEVLQPERPEKPAFDELVGESLTRSLAAGYKGEAMSTVSLAKETELHELITSVSNAELTLNTVVAVRDRFISSYQDIIKMPI